MTVDFVNPDMRYDALMQSWSVISGSSTRHFKDRDWEMRVAFTRNPLKTGDRAVTKEGLSVRIVAVYDNTGHAWVADVGLPPYTWPLRELRHADDV